MKYSLLKYTHVLNIDGNKYEFDDPLIIDYMRFEEMIEEGKYIEGILFIAPCFKKMNFTGFTLTAREILTGIIELLSTSNGPKRKAGGKSFLIADIDFFSERYGELPTEFIKLVRLHELKAMSKGVERNFNEANDKPDENIKIIEEQKDQDALLAEIKAMKIK